MAAAKKLAPPAAEAAPDTVQLRCEELGVTRDFAPAHAKALLKLQRTKGWNHWQPVEAAADTTTA